MDTPPRVVVLRPTFFGVCKFRAVPETRPGVSHDKAAAAIVSW
jgi:hypothetical protein